MKVLHFADVHIGIETYGKLDPATGLNTRLRDFVKSLAFVVDFAIEREVDLVLFVGDAYRSADPNPTHQRLFAEQVCRLSVAKIPTLLLAGNHDVPVAFGRASAIDIFGVLNVPHVVVVSKPELKVIETKSGVVQIACLPWPHRSMLLTRDEYRRLDENALNERIVSICAEQIEGWAEELDPQLPAILAAHVTAMEGKFSGSERTAVLGRDPLFLTSTLAHSAFDYVALGHLHKHQDLNPTGHPHVVYSGSIERVDFTEEHDTKGFCLVHLEKGNATYEFIRTPSRPFVTIDVSVPDDADDPTAVILSEIEKYDIQDAIVRVIYGISQEKASGLNLRRVQEALRPAHHVAYVMPRVAAQRRSTRVAELTETMGWQEAFDLYIQQHEELQPFAEELKAYARKLEEELKDER
ncbi:MAG: exonuclease SbcCD subunit D [Abditibacteriales bacterium]|nr:exonuclease SbcCD subunit D [Abditibacteriales bacterium]